MFWYVHLCFPKIIEYSYLNINLNKYLRYSISVNRKSYKRSNIQISTIYRQSSELRASHVVHCVDYKCIQHEPYSILLYHKGESDIYVNNHHHIKHNQYNEYYNDYPIMLSCFVLLYSIHINVLAINVQNIQWCRNGNT